MAKKQMVMEVEEEAPKKSRGRKPITEVEEEAPKKSKGRRSTMTEIEEAPKKSRGKKIDTIIAKSAPEPKKKTEKKGPKTKDKKMSGKITDTEKELPPTKMRDDLGYVPIDSIVVSEHSIRKEFGKEEDKWLRGSIDQLGVLQNLTVIKKDGHYELVSGERRYRAALDQGLTEVPVRIIDPRMLEQTGHDAITLALVENLQRTDPSTVEYAESICGLIGKGISKEQVADLCHVSKRRIYQCIDLGTAPEETKKAVASKDISTHDFRKIKSLPPDKQKEAIERIKTEPKPTDGRKKVNKEEEGEDNTIPREILNRTDSSIKYLEKVIDEFSSYDEDTFYEFMGEQNMLDLQEKLATLHIMARDFRKKIDGIMEARISTLEEEEV